MSYCSEFRTTYLLPTTSVVTINRRVEQSVGLGRNSDQSTGEMDNRFLSIIACPLLCGHVQHMATHEHNKTVKQTKTKTTAPLMSHACTARCGAAIL